MLTAGPDLQWIPPRLQEVDWYSYRTMAEALVA